MMEIESFLQVVRIYQFNNFSLFVPYVLHKMPGNLGQMDRQKDIWMDANQSYVPFDFVSGDHQNYNNSE